MNRGVNLRALLLLSLAVLLPDHAKAGIFAVKSGPIYEMGYADFD